MLSLNKKRKLAEKMMRVNLRRGQTIMSQGAQSDTLLMLVEGSCRLSYLPTAGKGKASDSPSREQSKVRVVCVKGCARV